MSNEKPTPEDSTDPPGPSIWLIGAVAGIGLLLLFNLMLLVLVADARREASAAAAQARKAVRLVQEIQQTLNAEQEAPTAPPAKPKGPAARPPQHIDAVDPTNDCVIRPGSGQGIGDCLR